MITNTTTRDYIDKDGIQRRVLIPEGVTDYSEGIPVSLPVDSLFADCPLSFRQELVAELWARGLVEPCDFRRAGAAELVSAALRSAIKKDALDVLALAREDCR